jgi:hypothetical protein
VEYQLTAEIAAPADNPQLDALQQHGVAALLDEHLDALAGIEGPDGVEIEPVDHQIAVQVDGATITWVLDAPALAFAEDAAQHALKELLERTDLLADWSVRRCEVTASDDELAAALEDGDDEDDEIDLELVLEAVEPSEDERAARREMLAEAAGQLHAFGAEAFGQEPGSEPARLAAGALMHSVESLTDELFADIQTLEDTGLPAGQVDALWVIDELPQRHADAYDAAFAKKFLVTLTILGYRLSQPGWTPPLSTAEALALHLVKLRAQNQLAAAGLSDELPVEEMFAAFDETVFEDADHEALFSDAEDVPEADGLAFDEWFFPYEHLTKALHPYLTAESDDDADVDAELVELVEDEPTE